MARVVEKEEVLRASLRTINAKLSRIDDEKRAAGNRKHVGKCFKYRNMSWWLYMRFTGLTKNGMLEGVEFQVDQYGNVFVRPTRTWQLDGDHQPISRAEFNQAWTRTMKRIQELDPRVAP